MLVVQALTDGRPGPVVLPSFTFSASAHAVMWNGRTPRFVECSSRSFQIDLADTSRQLAGASAIMATHVFGAPCNARELEELARAHGVPLVFDAAHALGASHRPHAGRILRERRGLQPHADQAARRRRGRARRHQRRGAWPRRCAWVATTATPATTTPGSPGSTHACRSSTRRWRSSHSTRFDESLERRRYLAGLYRDYLDDVPGIEFQTVSARDTSTFKDLTIRVDADSFGLSRDGLALMLLAEGVDTRKYFDPPVHRQRTYEHLEYRRLPVTDAVASSVLSLPGVPRLDRRARRAGLRDHPRRARALGRARRLRVDDGRGRRPHVRARLTRTSGLSRVTPARRTRARRARRSATGRRASARSCTSRRSSATAHPLDALGLAGIGRLAARGSRRRRRRCGTPDPRARSSAGSGRAAATPFGSQPVSSSVSRAAACSGVSPGSMRPAGYLPTPRVGDEAMTPEQQHTAIGIAHDRARGADWASARRDARTDRLRGSRRRRARVGAIRSRREFVRRAPSTAFARTVGVHYDLSGARSSGTPRSKAVAAHP